MATVLMVEEAGESWREPPTIGKQLLNLITRGSSRVHPFYTLQSREP